MRLTRSEIGKRMAAVGLGLFLAIAFMEILVRWIAPQPLQHIQLDDALYFVNRPLERFVYAREGEYKIDVAYNVWGFRGPLPEASRPPGLTRIMLLGDSQTEGLQVRYEETYGSVLREELERHFPGRRFEVINLAVSGYGTHQEILMLRRYGERVKPDWVILGFYPGNDIQDNVRLPLIKTKRNDVELVEHHFSFKHRLFLGTKIWLGSASHLYVFAMPHLKAALSREFLSRIGLIEPVRGPESLESESDSIYQSGPFSPGMAHDIDVTERLLKLARAEACGLGARFVVLTIPAKVQASREISERDGDLDRPEREFASRFDRLGIPHLEVLAPLRRAGDSGASPFFQRDGHMNATGHRVLGQALAGWLVPYLKGKGNGLVGC